MSALESTIQKDIRLRLGKLGMIFLRYNVGLFYSVDGRPVKIGEPGVSDLIGIVPHVVTQEDVGRTIGVFAAIETKREKKHERTKKAQKEGQGNFIAAVKRSGGIAGIARGEDDAVKIVSEKWDL